MSFCLFIHSLNISQLHSVCTEKWWDRVKKKKKMNKVVTIFVLKKLRNQPGTFPHTGLIILFWVPTTFFFLFVCLFQFFPQHSKYVSTLLLLLLSYFSRVRPTLCDPIDGSPPGSAVPGILQARTLEWVSISFSNA